MSLRLEVRGDVADDDLAGLHARAFGTPGAPGSWRARLERHSLTWVLARDGDRLVGFANVAWDGGAHAFLLDVIVDPAGRRDGTGRALVRTAALEAARAGCQWLHVDFDEALSAFYLGACGFRATAAGVLRLDGEPGGLRPARP
jgi:ribosomal protein S18 acetylase RimI-like enzyme